MKDDISICLHGHNFVFGEGGLFEIEAGKTITFFECSENGEGKIVNCATKQGDQVSFVSSENIDATGELVFDKVNVETNSLFLNNSNVTFKECAFDFKEALSVHLIKTDNAVLNITKNEFDDPKGNFMFINKSKITWNSVSVKNYKETNAINVIDAELTLDGKCIFEGNKNVIRADDAKVYIKNGSGDARDVLTETPRQEYTMNLIQKEYTKLFDYNDDKKANIIFRNNTGSYVIGAAGSYIEFDAVIAGNELDTTDASLPCGAYVNISNGELENELILLNRAYVNQNKRNIVVSSKDIIKGSKKYNNGTFDTLNRDATLSFYPVEEDILVLRDVIKKNEESNILVARDFTSQDMKTTYAESYLYKVCMLQGYRDDLYQRDEQNLSFGKEVVCDIVNENGYKKGTFRLKNEERRYVKINLHAGDGWFPSESTEKTKVHDYVFYYYPFGVDQYNLSSKNDWASHCKPVWIDETCGEPYEYEFDAWSPSPKNRVTKYLPNQPYNNVKLLGNTFDDLRDFNYYDEIDLYACWIGDKKYEYTFVAEPMTYKDGREEPIEKWTVIKKWGREGLHPFTYPTKEECDYKYDCFDLIGWRGQRVKNKYGSRTIEYNSDQRKLGELVQSMPYYTGDDVPEDGDPIEVEAMWQGDMFNIYYYLANEKIVNCLYPLDEKGFYQATGSNARFLDSYRTASDKTDVVEASLDITWWKVQEGYQFFGWTRQVLKDAIEPEEMEKIEFIDDFYKYSVKADSYYYPVICRYDGSPVEHDDHKRLDTYTILQSIDSDGNNYLPSGKYQLVLDTFIDIPILIKGDVYIDLHGYQLSITKGGYFYGDGNLKFHCCKDKVGTLYNDTVSEIYKGDGKITFEKISLEGINTYFFDDMKEEVDFIDVKFNDLMHEGYFWSTESRFTDILRAENSTVNIKDCNIDSLGGRFIADRGGVLNFENFTMVNCRQTYANRYESYRIKAYNKSTIKINAPSYFENNCDIIYVENSKLEIISNGDHFPEDGDVSKIKDKNVIFYKTVGASVIESTKGAELVLSGIITKSDTGSTIVRTTPGVKTRISFNGFCYFADNEYGLPLRSNCMETYEQRDTDRIKPNSVFHYHFFDWNALTICNPYWCRGLVFMSNLHKDDSVLKERDEDGSVKNIKIVYNTPGWSSRKYEIVVDGIYYNEETERGYSAHACYAKEFDLIDIDFNVDRNTCGYGVMVNSPDNPEERIYVRNGDTIIQYNRKDPEEVKKVTNWLKNLDPVVVWDEEGSPFNTEDFYFDYVGLAMSRHEVRTPMDSGTFMPNLSEASMHFPLFMRFECHKPITNYYIMFEYNLPKKPDGKTYDKLPYISGSHIKTITDLNEEVLFEEPNYDHDCPFEFSHYVYKFEDQDGPGEIEIYPGDKVRLFDPLKETDEYYVTAVWKPKKVKVTYILNKNITYKGSSDKYVVMTQVGENYKPLDIKDIKVANGFTFTGWVKAKHLPQARLEGMPLPDDLSLKNIVDNFRLFNVSYLSKNIFIEKAEDLEVKPAYYLTSTTINDRTNQNTDKKTSSGGNSGSGRGGSSGGSNLSGLTNLTQTYAYLQELGVKKAEPAAAPSNESPFGIETFTDKLSGQTFVLDATDTGKLQMEKADAVIKAALADPNRQPANVSSESIKPDEAKWTKADDGKWMLNSASTNGQVKDTWQKVEGSDGSSSWYKFDAEGKMQTGWVADGDFVYYIIESGENEGKMIRDVTVNIGGYEFKFSPEGALVSMHKTA